MTEDETNSVVKKLDVTYGDIRIELHIGEPYLNEANAICIPFVRRLYLMKKGAIKAARKEYLQ